MPTCEIVTRNDGGRLLGQRYGVDPGLIDALAKKGWDEKSPKQIAKRVVNAVSLYDLQQIKDGRLSSTSASLTMPGSRRITIPIIVDHEASPPNLLLDTAAKIKYHA